MHPSDPKLIWIQYSAKLKKKQTSGNDLMRVGLAGSFTMDPLVPYLGGCLLKKGIPGPVLSVGPFNQLYQLCFDPAAAFGKDALHGIVLLWRVEDLVPVLLEKASVGDVQAAESLFEELDRFQSAIHNLRKSFEGTLIISTPPYPSLPSFDILEMDQPVAGMMLHNNILRRWTDGLNSIGRIKIIDMNGLLLQEGFACSHDARKWYLYKQPYTEAFWAKVGEQTSRIIAAEFVSAKKCIVFDCDNTIWGGIIGEDGLSGIELGEDFPGNTFRDFQKYLLYLRNRGILLAIASRNNKEDVVEVFEKHDAMILSLDHISVIEAHWNSKVESLKNIAAALNIGTDSLVFIDDNPKEISEVQARLPEVTCFLVPEEIAFLPNMLRGTGLFDTTGITDEDRARAEMMKAEQKRKEVSAGQSEEDFLRSLELVINVFEAEPIHMARVTQLINKTNQFNLTTIRRTQDELEAMVSIDHTHVFTMDMEDRFGKYGLVGVAIVKKTSEEEWFIDTFLMSCRALGRGAETSFLAKIASAVKYYGGKTLRGEYRPTKKNALAKDFYRNHGFDREDASGQWIASVDSVKKPSDYVNVSLKLVD